jgi:hypothetical protein
VPSTNQHGEPGDTSGRPLTGRAADIAKRAHDRRVAAQEHLAEFQSFARLMVAALGGIDTVRARLGRDDALRVASLAGLPVDLIAGQWAASDPGSTRQVSRVHPDQGYSEDPSHDERVITAVMSGAPMEEVGKVRAQVTKEYAARRAAASARTRDDTADLGIPGVRYDGGVPVQRSGPGNTDGSWDPINHRVVARPKSDIWTDLPDHQPGFQDRTNAGIGSNGMPAPASGQVVPGAATAVLNGCPESADGRHRGGRFCAYCGGSLTGQQQD